MQSIQQSERFQNDLKRFNSVIDKMPEGTDKADFQKLVNNLILEVRKMDTMFIDMIYSNQITSTGKEQREKITDIRKNLEDKFLRYSKIHS